MAAIQDAMNLYVSIVQKWKKKSEESVISLGAVSNDQVYVGGILYDFDSVSANRIVDGDAVLIARSDDDSRVVVLG